MDVGYQRAAAAADEPCFFRFQSKVGTGKWSAWTIWVGPDTYGQWNFNDTVPPGVNWYMNVECKDVAGNPATNSPQTDFFTMGPSGCP
ncbi:MAG: hypothetical protein ABIF77_20275 [bacterium]